MAQVHKPNHPHLIYAPISASTGAQASLSLSQETRCIRVIYAPSGENVVQLTS